MRGADRSQASMRLKRPVPAQRISLLPLPQQGENALKCGFPGQESAGDMLDVIDLFVARDQMVPASAQHRDFPGVQRRPLGMPPGGADPCRVVLPGFLENPSRHSPRRTLSMRRLKSWRLIQLLNIPSYDSKPHGDWQCSLLSSVTKNVTSGDLYCQVFMK